LPLNGYPSYLQLYFYDIDHKIENRIYDLDRLNPSILRKIIDILKINPYCAFFWSLKDVRHVPNLKHQQIHTRSNVSLNQRVYNTPSTSQVAAIWVDENTSKQLMS
jgi:hypothetical protein